jgi:hypothetical protein
MKVYMLNEKWTVTDPTDPSTWPEDQQEIYYIFTPLGEMSIFEGVFFRGKDSVDGSESGCFTSMGGFCDLYDAPFWRPRGKENEQE